MKKDIETIREQIAALQVMIDGGVDVDVIRQEAQNLYREYKSVDIWACAIHVTYLLQCALTDVIIGVDTTEKMAASLSDLDEMLDVAVNIV